MSILISCHPSDVVKIRIACRCGQRFIQTFPKMIREGQNVVVCRCGRMFVSSWCQDHNQYETVNSGMIKDHAFEPKDDQDRQGN